MRKIRIFFDKVKDFIGIIWWFVALILMLYTNNPLYGVVPILLLWLMVYGLPIIRHLILKKQEIDENL